MRKRGVLCAESAAVPGLRAAGAAGVAGGSATWAAGSGFGVTSVGMPFSAAFASRRSSIGSISTDWKAGRGVFAVDGRDHHEIGASNRFRHRRLAGARKIDEDMIDCAGASRLAEFVGKAVAFDGLDREAFDVRLAPPAFERPVLIEIEDEHPFTALGKAGSDRGARRGLAHAALGGRKGNNHKKNLLNSCAIGSRGNWTKGILRECAVGRTYVEI